MQKQTVFRFTSWTMQSLIHRRCNTKAWEMSLIYEVGPCVRFVRMYFPLFPPPFLFNLVGAALGSVRLRRMGSHSQISGSQESLPSVGPPIVSHNSNKGFHEESFSQEVSSFLFPIFFLPQNQKHVGTISTQLKKNSQQKVFLLLWIKWC